MELAAAGGEGDIDGGGPSELQIIPPVESLELEKEFTVDKRFLRPQFLAQTKSNNYLLNVMCAMESASKGGAGYGVWVEDDTDYVIEGAVCSAALPAPAPAPQRPHPRERGGAGVLRGLRQRRGRPHHAPHRLRAHRTRRVSTTPCSCTAASVGRVAHTSAARVVSARRSSV